MAEFTTRDNRRQPRAAVPDSALTKAGISIQRARQDTGQGLPFGDPSRRFGEIKPTGVGRRTALATPNVQMAMSRPRDPMWYWKQNNIPFDFTDPSELSRIREFVRLLYATHPIVSGCVDIFSQLPLQGAAFECKDDQLVDFYGDLFFDQLDYEAYLVKLGRQYWLSGESWSLGGWNETLGIWEADQLINPDDIEIEDTLFLNEPRFLMRLPESLRKVLSTRQPYFQYAQLISRYPELLNYLSQDALMPVSNIILKQMRFAADDFTNRGIPILMRGFRSIIQEEMLNSALDSIADRLYTPLILTKLGASASDLGTSVPWIPTQDEMAEFNGALDAALAADFRALTYHWAIDMQPVFGRENVPDLGNDFDRITERLLMVFGLSQTMLTGASEGETFAADALNRDVVSQRMSGFQKMQKKFLRDRMLIVAEAQEHFDYEVRNGMRYLITEEIYEVDEESGEGKVVEQPKLLVPDVTFKSINLDDEEQERQFIETLVTNGVPIAYRARVQGVGMDFDEMVEQRSQEQVRLSVAEQETRKKTYLALLAQGLPIAADLKADFAPKAISPPVPPGGVMGGAHDQVLPTLGGTLNDYPALAPALQEMEQTAQQDAQAGPDQLPPGAPPADADADADGDGQNDDEEQENPDVPPESNEQRKGMPKASTLRRYASMTTEQLTREAFRAGISEVEQKVVAILIQRHEFATPQATTVPLRKTAALPKLGMHEVARKYYVEPDNSEEVEPRDYQPVGKFGPPRHVGLRRHLNLAEVPVYREEQDED